MLLAHKVGGSTYLIPDDYRQQFAALGFSGFEAAPPSTPIVSRPEIYEDVIRRAAAIAPPAIETSPRASSGTVAPARGGATRSNKRGRR